MGCTRKTERKKQRKGERENVRRPEQDDKAKEIYRESEASEKEARDNKMKRKQA